MQQSGEIGALVRDGFRCPICDFDAYCRIIVYRADLALRDAVLQVRRVLGDVCQS